MARQRNPYSKHSKKKQQAEFWHKYNNSSQEYRDSIDNGVNWFWFVMFIIVIVGFCIKMLLFG